MLIWKSSKISFKEIEKFKVEEIPENLIEQEVAILSQGMKEDEIKKNNIPTFCVAARATAGGTYASSFFMHDLIIIESKCVENLLFSGKRVTANILKGTDQIPDDFGTG